MAKFLGETLINVKNTDTPFKFYQPKDWALYLINQYGQIDGDHHKAWVLDQVARILHGADVIVTIAEWDDGHTEYRITLADKEPVTYTNWVIEHKAGEDGPDSYGYDCGIAP